MTGPLRYVGDKGTQHRSGVLSTMTWDATSDKREQGFTLYKTKPGGRGGQRQMDLKGALKPLWDEMQPVSINRFIFNSKWGGQYMDQGRKNSTPVKNVTF